MKDLQEDVILWLPTHLTEDADAIASVTKANGLIMDFCDRDIALEQVLDEFSTIGISADEFMATLDFNLRLRGI